MKTRRDRRSLALVASLLALLFLESTALGAAGSAGADKTLLQGNWKVLQGTYSDGSVEKELDMSFTFTPTTLTNPMDGSSLAYVINEGTKSITATGADSSIAITYKVVDRKTVDFLEMKVSSKGKTTVIVGQGGMFSLLRLGKK